MTPMLVVAACLVFADAEPSQPMENSQVRAVAAKESYPWYDTDSGGLTPILPQPDLGGGWLASIGDWFGRKLAWVPRMFRRLGRWLSGLNGWRIRGVAGLGELIAIGLVLAVLAILVVILMEMLRRYRPMAAAPVAGSVVLRAGEGSRIEGLPANAGFDASDPWAEATRRRARGDHAGAVIYLFAYQLLAARPAEHDPADPGPNGPPACQIGGRPPASRLGRADPAPFRGRLLRPPPPLARSLPEPPGPTPEAFPTSGVASTPEVEK